MIPDDWGRLDGRTPQGSCLAISAYLSERGAGMHHYVEVARRWSVEFLHAPTSLGRGRVAPPPWLQCLRKQYVTVLKTRAAHINLPLTGLTGQCVCNMWFNMLQRIFIFRGGFHRDALSRDICNNNTYGNWVYYSKT